MMVQWTQPNLLTVYKPTGTKGGPEAFSVAQHILPGINEIPDTEWEALKKNSMLVRLMDEGMLKEVEKDRKEGKGKSGTSGYSVKDAKDIVKGTYDTKLLTTWKAHDSRPEIVLAIDAQLKDIEKRTMKTAEEKAEDEDND